MKIKKCKKHGDTEYAQDKFAKSWRCKKCRNEKTQKHRRKLKDECYLLLGGKCISCGYDRSFLALDFHHRDPATKSFRIGQGGGVSREKVLKEISKCDLLCSNCHRELHGGLRNISPPYSLKG